MGTVHNNFVLPFNELVLVQNQILARWFGRCEITNAHIFAKANNNNLIKNNLVTRVSLDNFRDLNMFQSINLPPPEPIPATYLNRRKPKRDGGKRTGKKMCRYRTSRQFSTNVTTIYDIFCPVPFLLSVFGFRRLKMVESNDQPSTQMGGERELRLVYPFQTSNEQPQYKAPRTHTRHVKGVFFQLPLRLTQWFVS